MVKQSRRDALKNAVLMPLATSMGTLLPARASAAQLPVTSKSLVAYFSRTGNTRVIAGQIRRATSSDMLEIVPASAYPEDYEQTVAQARRETEAGFEPPLVEISGAIDAYEVVYLGLPVWGTTAPPVIRSFLSKHDLAGTTLIPFITHGGYGLGSSLDVLVKGFVIEADQERRTLESVTGWLKSLDYE